MGLFIEFFVNCFRVLYIEVWLLKTCFSVDLQVNIFSVCRVKYTLLYFIKNIIQNILAVYFILVSFHIVFPFVSL